ncbi:MAG: hypothetical protein CM15mV11_0660 [Caudoviricetes sp.]|nr:MAG: hypothetical protein CM15mV11_0660 [Caudoviricetes sp.]
MVILQFKRLRVLVLQDPKYCSNQPGSGTSTVSITAEDVVDIQASDASTGKVHVENMRIQGDHLASTGTLKLDPAMIEQSQVLYKS